MGLRSQLLEPYFKFFCFLDQTPQLSAHEGLLPMKTFVAPSLLLSFVRRSNALLQNSGRFSGTIVTGYPRTCCTKAAAGGLSMVTDNMTAAAGPGAAAVGHAAATTHRKSATWPLGLDPDKCKVAEIHEQIRRRGYTPSAKPGDRTKAGLLKQLRGLVRAESFAPPDATITSGGEASGVTATNSDLQGRWNPDAGRVDKSTLEKGPNGFSLCRFCNEETPSARRTFCSEGCVHEHKIRTQGSYVRRCLSTRDGGQCAECGVDAAGLYRRARSAWLSGDSLAMRRHLVALEMVGTPLEGKVPREGATRRPTQGQFWHADHIVPVARGGGQCSLNNYRTLCVPCHKKTTKRLAGERAVERAGAAAAKGLAKPSAAPGRGRGGNKTGRAVSGRARGGRGRGRGRAIKRSAMRG